MGNGVNAGPPARCKNCGLRFQSRALRINSATNVTIIGSSETCPRCGGEATIADGTYDFVRGLVSRFNAEGVDRESINTFRSIIKDVEEGRKSAQEAESLINGMGDALGSAWKWANSNAGALGLLLTIVTIYLAIITAMGSDEDAAKLRSDLAKQTAIVQKIEVELQKQYVAAPETEEQLPPTHQMRQLHQRQTPASGTGPNRHERRKAARLSKRPS